MTTRPKGWIAPLAVLALAAAACRAPSVVLPPGEGIGRAELEAHVRFLASDEMRGRMTGSPESERAAAYLAAALKEAGVAPAGAAGGYLQEVPVVRSVTRALPTLEITTRDGRVVTAEAGADFDAPSDAKSAGPVPVIVAASPGAMPEKADAAKALFVDASTAGRRQWLRDAGLGEAAGFAILFRPGSDERREKAAALPPPSRLRLDGAAAARRPGWVDLHGPVLALFRAGDVASVKLVNAVELERVPSHNVVGIVRARASAEDAKAIVLTAHYDHIGVVRSTGAAEPAAGADTVYNGADDDASGVAAVLEIAEELAAGPAPARPVVVVLVTGEEIGLLGTEAYLDAPVVPLDRTAANLNFEMVGRPDPLAGGPGVLWLTGFELSNLGPAFAAASLRIVADPHPEQNFFRRSDNIAFVRRGIVAQSLSSYSLHADYHRPSDEADKLDYAHMETTTRAAFNAVRLLAEGAIEPAWVGEPPSVR